MRLRLLGYALTAALTVFPSSGFGAVLDFEGFPDSTILTSQYGGIVFQNTILYKALYTLDEGEFPPRSGENVASDFGGLITLSFAHRVTGFSGYFTYLTQLRLAPLDANGNVIPGSIVMADFNNNLLVSGDAGSAPNELIEITRPAGFFGVAILGDAAGGSFTMDDVTIIPEPGTFLPVAASALLALAWAKRRLRSRASGIVAMVLACAALVHAAPTTFPAAVSPAVIPPNVATPVVVTATIADPTVIPTTVILQRIDNAGRITNPNLGLLHDDGLNGDAAAGDTIYSIRVSFTEAAGALRLQVSAGFRNTLKRVVSNPVTLTSGAAFTGAMREVSFTGDIAIRKDAIGAVPLIVDPVWKSTNPPSENNPAAYVSGNTMTADIKFALNPVPAAPIPNVTVRGTIPGLGAFVKAGVTLPAAAEATVTGLTADTPLPASRTRFYNTMDIAWTFTEGANTTNLGTTSHQIYVTLAAPLNANVFLTTLVLAVSRDGATDAASALANTWALFSAAGGPANVTSWSGRPLTYYPDGIGFGGCVADELPLLISPTGGGQCASFMYLMIAALNVNGISASRIRVDAIDSTHFLVPRWLFGAQSLLAIDPAFPYRLTMNPIVGGSLDMVPKQPGNIYGDLRSQPGIPGQNSPTPSEKIFIRHFIVLPAAPLNTRYYDPSYGVTYTSANNFETTAVVGYIKSRPPIADPDPPNQWRVRRSTGLMNIQLTVF